MKRIVFVLLIGIPVSAVAQQPPEMALMPRQLVEMAAGWIAHPDATTAVQLYAGLQACLADNPTNGVVRRTGVDECPVVTQALAARDAAQKKAVDEAAPEPKAAPKK